MGMYSNGEPRFFIMELIEELYKKWQKRRAFKKEMKRLDNFKPIKTTKKDD